MIKTVIHDGDCEDIHLPSAITSITITNSPRLG
jgi:hypothetical protein